MDSCFSLWYQRESEAQTASFRIWTRVAEFISYDDNRMNSAIVTFFIHTWKMILLNYE